MKVRCKDCEEMILVATKASTLGSKASFPVGPLCQHSSKSISLQTSEESRYYGPMVEPSNIGIMEKKMETTIL